MYICKTKGSIDSVKTMEDKSPRQEEGRWVRYCTVGLCCVAVGIGIGIGIGSGIWNTSTGKNDSFTGKSAVCADEGEHAAPLLTYTLQSNNVQVTPLDTGYMDFNGTFAEIRFNRSSIPSTVPYMMNMVADGILLEDVLNSTQFLDDWAWLSQRAGTKFAMPGEIAAYQCFSEYDASNRSMSFDTAPPNALIRFDADPSQAVLVDIFNVRTDLDAYVLTVRQAPIDSRLGVREGECHPVQSVDEPHYHHVPICSDLILAWNVELSQVDGLGMTAFIKVVTTNRIQAQASTTTLSIANAVPQSVLSILGG